ncbi:hypothetical protein TTHERM_00320360 (macronuclear) [Tetrahymena thermophila SB210]|uniref:DUF7932 domain-containing protein n=1 Tax=Tetrahymena thermophila (strain SB210) TaxID=312017 RepID=Q237Q1_TETTS|nr:hypothetical protein TTHERM_00320360 [Tetrahymena thermophila SB210]EAR92690.1 hypothetical protein TTHERM_00320360 [Tetrahymena thermophila SB210]|eukprot:XP_001012935.1 hypothetical protein TTHERM_00320360 [Tetrahymena thermophila SB210]
MIHFNYDGESGKSGYRGSSGSSGSSGKDGQNGSNGGQGSKGSNACALDLQMSAQGDQIVIIETNYQNKRTTLPLGNSSNGITFSACGGSGGRGGDGGNGGRGGDGCRGNDATQSSCGTDGGNGGNGGNGGDGGHGGDGGNGANISVRVNQEDMDILMIVGSYICYGGAGGSGGKGGFGGRGGSGGSGGSSYSWTETDSEGNTNSYSNQGGRDGHSGIGGRSGNIGRSGQSGSDGSFYYVVQGNKYYSRYNLSINSVEKVQSDDNIIEPGEYLQINQMSLANDGGMPTPTHQRIQLSLVSNQYLTFKQSDSVYIAQSINSGQKYQLQSPLKFQINEQLQPAIDSVFRVTTNLNYKATVERVNKSFENISKYATQYQIRYPVELSEIQVLRSIQLKEEAPIAFSIANLSSKPIGFETISKRLLNIRVVLNNTSYVAQFYPKAIIDQDKERRNSLEKANLSYSSDNYINPQPQDNINILLDQEFVTSLMPNEKKIISGTIKFVDLDLAYNTNYEMSVHLDLGYYHNQQNLYQTIQTRKFAIQLSQPYENKENSEYLLIVNSETKRALIEQIKQFAYSFGSHVDIWNISNYQGFNFDYVGNADKSFKELYKNKVIIVLCNDYKLINGATHNAVKQIGEKNIYNSIKFHQIQYYILGQKNLYDSKWLTSQNLDDINLYEKKVEDFDIVKKRFSRNFLDTLIKRMNVKEQEQLTIRQQHQAYQFNYLEKLYCCCVLEEKLIQQRCQKILKEIEQKNCRYYHKIIYNYRGKIIEDSIFSKLCNIGSVKVVEALRKDQAQVIERSCYIELKQEVDSVDKFCLVKLLSFEKKLLFFTRSLTNVENAKLVINCILSDLVDEFITYQKSGIPSTEYRNYMNKWNQVYEFQFQNYFQINKKQNKQDNYKANLEKQNNNDQAKIKIREYFHSQIFQFKISLSKQQNCFQKLFCCFSSLSSLISHCNYILDSISQKLFQSKKEVKNQNEIIKYINQNLLASSLVHIQQPYLNDKNLDKEGFCVSNIHMNSQFLSIQEYGIYKQDPYQSLNRIQEGSFFFLDENSQQVDQIKRQSKIEHFERLIKFQND